MRSYFVLLIYFIILGCQLKNESPVIATAKKVIYSSSDSVPPTAKKLIENYKDYIIGYADNYLIFKDSSVQLWDDGKKNKTFIEVLNNPDIEDMFSQKYDTGMQQSVPAANYDPGRIRNEAFFKKLYGKTKDEVRRNLTEIEWCPNLVKQKIKVTTINGIDKKFILISTELDKHPELQKYISNIGGTFKWRLISGTKRLSMHSFGMTIDVNTAWSNYWQWDCKCTNEDAILKYKNQIPQFIVNIFEKHGFIWGGKWYHYDTMHFEYRPELL
jgi:hypothetical protein